MDSEKQVDDFFSWEDFDGAVVITPKCHGGSFAEEESRAVWSDLFDQLRESDKGVVADFHALDYFGSTMLDWIASVNKLLRTDQRKLALCNVSDAGLEVLRIARFDTLWPLCDDRQSAIEAVS